jgi:UDP-GlcNAc:undecaprenyl-phosphate/decaprenyl-phosphate GlcNAc-1-phosphate transferase
MTLALFFVLCVVVSVVVIRLSMTLARRFGVLDHPGGHKQHDTSTPFVGGVGVVAVVLVGLFLGAAYFPHMPLRPILIVAAGACVLFLTGFADDLWQLHFKTRFAIQVMVATAMVLVGGVEILCLGEVIPGLPCHLGLLSLPFTVFATIGLINALNMIDGIDGLSGTLSFISLGFAALVASLAQNGYHLVFIVSVMGGIVGFLYYNLRYPGNHRARVFLGDNGSMLLGFLFAWILISLSQGEQPAMTPVTVLWIFGVPLLDTVGIMLRRIWLGKSPFHADRYHLHHLFIRAGFRVCDTVLILAVVQLTLGAIGVAGLRLGVPESLMFYLFLLTFAGYFYAVARPWRVVPNLYHLNQALGMPSVQARGVFVGYFKKEGARAVLDTLAKELADHYDYRLSLHEVASRPKDKPNVYALIEIEGNMDGMALGELHHLMSRIKRHLSGLPLMHMQLFMNRTEEHDRRTQIKDKGSIVRGQKNDRRSVQEDIAFYTTTIHRDNGNQQRALV